MSTKAYPRNRRIAEQIQRTLSELLRREVKDPRLGPVTITEVRVSKGAQLSGLISKAVREDAKRRDATAQDEAGQAAARDVEAAGEQDEPGSSR